MVGEPKLLKIGVNLVNRLRLSNFHQQLLVSRWTAVYASIQELVPNLHILTYFFSDGGPVHFKNSKNFAYLSLFKRDFIGIIAHWFFSGPGHGKSMADAVGGAVKKLARLAPNVDTSTTRF